MRRFPTIKVIGRQSATIAYRVFHGTAGWRHHLREASRPIESAALGFLVLTLTGIAAGSSIKDASPTPVVAWYSLSRGEGSRVLDRTGHHNDAEIIGPYFWDAADQGLKLDGTSYLRVPSSKSLGLSRNFTLVAWFSGHGESRRFVERPHDENSLVRRAPYFQVAGDRVWFTYNNDLGAFFGKPEVYSWTFWPLWIGNANSNFSSWQDGYAATEGVEPKMQVTKTGANYEWFGRDGVGVAQIWAGRSDLELKSLKPIQETHRQLDPSINHSDGAVEQEGNIQVVENHVYYAFPQMDSQGKWQVWTAVSDLDGTNFVERQQTTDGGWIPYLQVAGDSIYYIYARQNLFPVQDLFICRSKRDGTEWHTLARLGPADTSWGQLTIDGGQVLFSYAGLKDDGTDVFTTGSLNLDGSNLKVTPQPPEGRSIAPGNLQVVGDRIFYSFGIAGDNHATAARSWIGSARRDGSDWKAEEIEPPLVMAGSGYGQYKGFVTVGGKTYLAASQWRKGPKEGQVESHIFLGSSGSNILSKGDAYGIGLSENLTVSAFANVGQDYLFRGEARSDTGGTVASFELQDTQVHQVVAVYSGQIVKLYIDGVESSHANIATQPELNDFPLLIGDGFVGTLKEVRLFNQSLTDQVIKRMFESERRTFDPK